MTHLTEKNWIFKVFKKSSIFYAPPDHATTTPTHSSLIQRVSPIPRQMPELPLMKAVYMHGVVGQGTGWDKAQLISTSQYNQSQYMSIQVIQRQEKT